MAESTQLGSRPEDRVASDTQRALRAIVRRAPLVVACAALAASAALVFSLLQTDKYTAEASLLFRDPGFDQRLFGGEAFQTNDPDRDAATNVRLASLDVIADLTAEDLNDGLNGDDVSDMVTVDSDGQSNVVSIDATDTDPEFAALVANTFAQNYIDFRREADRDKVRQAARLVEEDLESLSPEEQGGQAGQSLARELSRLKTLEALQTGNAELVEEADVPDSPSSPRTLRNTILGGILGGLLGIGLAVLFERLDRRLRDPEDFEEAFGLPVLSSVPNDKKVAASQDGLRLLLSDNPDALQMLRTRLRYFNVDRDIRTVLVTSSAPGDGKTTISWSLAAAAANAGVKALLLEADLHRSSVAAGAGLAPLPGLAEVLSGQAQLDDAIQRVAIGPEANGAEEGRTMDVIVAGSHPPNSAELLESERMTELASTLRSRYELVVIDTPPVSRLADAIPLIRLVDGVIVVGQMTKTTRDEALHLSEQLASLDAPVLGVVANRTPTRGRYSGYYGYGYGGNGTGLTVGERES